jgi:predicted phosphodiesterase
MALGDVHGAFRRAAALAETARTDLGGRLDVILSVGDLEANRNARDAAGVATGKGHRRWVGEFPKVLNGDIEFPSPLYFIGGDHEPWATLDSRGPGEIYPGFHFLGRAGVRDVMGLRVGFLSGVRGEASEGELFSRYGRDERACYVEIELVALSRSLNKHGEVDVLLTHDWAAGADPDRGSDDVRALLDNAHIDLHLCGHQHQRLSTIIEGTRVEALSDVLSDDGGYATFVQKRSGVIERVS